MPSRAEKLTVFKGIVLAWILSGAFIRIGYKFFPEWEVLDFDSSTHALGFALACGALSLILGVGWGARSRHMISNIDGSAPEPGSQLDITLRYNKNTAEQLLIFALAAFAFASAYPEISRALLPVMGIWFLIARALFWWGYHKHPLKRATGFAATFHPTIILLIAAIFGLIKG